jgi:hypothetical protein
MVPAITCQDVQTRRGKTRRVLNNAVSQVIRRRMYPSSYKYRSLRVQT